MQLDLGALEKADIAKIQKNRRLREFPARDIHIPMIVILTHRWAYLFLEI